MSDPVEVTARARCPHHATPERHPWYNECPLCRMPARFDGSGPDGELTVTLVGRDALVMAWARTTLVAMGDRTLYSEALPSVAAAMKAIREWDAAHSAEGEKDG